MPYHKFKDEEGNESGSFEVFYQEAPGRGGYSAAFPGGAGWYWWACFPGCLPDGDPSGPFASEQDAINDAQES
jgi:hypothetical protein